MATYMELAVDQGTDPDIALAVTEDGEVAELGAAEAIELYLKPHRTTADDDPAVTVLTVGDGITLTGSGTATATIPAAAIATAGYMWWRLDVVMSGRRRTAIDGLLLVRDT